MRGLREGVSNVVDENGIAEDKNDSDFEDWINEDSTQIKGSPGQNRKSINEKKVKEREENPSKAVESESERWSQAMAMGKTDKAQDIAKSIKEGVKNKVEKNVARGKNRFLKRQGANYFIITAFSKTCFLPVWIVIYSDIF